jgi:hypothetical protein
MAKQSTAEELAAYEDIASTIHGAGVGFWAATIFAAPMPMGRFYLMSGIAIGLMACGVLFRFLTKRQMRKAAHA